MDQKKLYKTVETIASQSFSTEKDMLIAVLNQIVQQKETNITGGRIWQLNTQKEGYKLFYQTGKIERITPGFLLTLKGYPVFNLIAKERTILGNETNAELRKKGIFKYSASGVGEKIKIRDKFYYEYLLALNSDEIDEELRYTLSIIAAALTSQIKQRRYSVRAKTFKADLDKARELQKSILPEHEYRFQNYELFGITNPAEIVGGDFFDFLEVGEDGLRLGIVVGDAASKGVSAAAEAMYISGAIRMASSFEIKISPLMKRVNQLVNKIFTDDKFASLFYGELSADRGGLFLYANAGHNPPIFLRSSTNNIIKLDSTGPVIGPTPNAKYSIENINFFKGDILVIYSDGVIESTDAEFNYFGEERLINKLLMLKTKTVKEIAYSILEDVVKFSKKGKYNDDKSLVIIKRVK